LHQVAGELMESEGDFPHAADQYQKALEKDPSLAGIRRALGVALMNSSQDDAARLVRLPVDRLNSTQCLA